MYILIPLPKGIIRRFECINIRRQTSHGQHHLPVLDSWVSQPEHHIPINAVTGHKWAGIQGLSHDERGTGLIHIHVQ
jgi:hypothetical protein